MDNIGIGELWRSWLELCEVCTHLPPAICHLPSVLFLGCNVTSGVRKRSQALTGCVELAVELTLMAVELTLTGGGQGGCVGREAAYLRGD
jgi:hypothetical protein